MHSAATSNQKFSACDLRSRSRARNSFPQSVFVRVDELSVALYIGINSLSLSKCTRYWRNAAGTKFIQIGNRNVARDAILGNRLCPRNSRLG